MHASSMLTLNLLFELQGLSSILIMQSVFPCSATCHDSRLRFSTQIRKAVRAKMLNTELIHSFSTADERQTRCVGLIQGLT